MALRLYCQNTYDLQKNSLFQILSRLVQDRLNVAKDVLQSPEAPVNFTELATQTEGYSATDLKDLVARAMHQVAMRAINISSTKVPMPRNHILKLVH